MTPKYKKILGNVVIGAALFWILGFLADIFIPLLIRRFGDPSVFYGYDGVGITIASCVSGAAVAITLIVCLVKSKKESTATQDENSNEAESESAAEAGTTEETVSEPETEPAEETENETGEENEHPE